MLRGQPETRYRSANGFRVALRLDPLEDFLSMNINFSRRIDSNAHLVTLHTDDGHTHIRSDHDSFTDPARYD
jgi:hypothetical protein